jgi:hypothetical protein
MVVGGAWTRNPPAGKERRACHAGGRHQHRRRSAACSTRTMSITSRRGPDPAGRDDRRHRADAAHRPASPPGRSPAERAHAGDGGRMSDVKPGQGAHDHRAGHYLFVAAILFTIGVLGIFLNRKNVIIILMSIELILLAVNINFVAFSAFSGDLSARSSPVRAHRRGRGGGDRARHPRRLFPQPRHHRGRRHQSDEGLRRVQRDRLPAALARSSPACSAA